MWISKQKTVLHAIPVWISAYPLGAIEIWTWRKFQYCFNRIPMKKITFGIWACDCCFVDASNIITHFELHFRLSISWGTQRIDSVVSGIFIDKLLAKITLPMYWRAIRIQMYLNTLGPRHNGGHFPDDIFKCIFLNENVWILIKISLKLFPMVVLSKLQHWFW